MYSYIMRQRDDRPYDLRILLVKTHAVYKGAVNLEAINWESMQIAQGGIVSPEVIDS